MRKKSVARIIFGIFLISVFIFTTAALAVIAKNPDINGDGVFDTRDIGELITYYGQNALPDLLSDRNSDGRVNGFDYTLLSNELATASIPIVPGKIEAEDFTNYYDKTTGNSGGAYRNTDVDIKTNSEGSYTVGWFLSGEWLEYKLKSTGGINKVTLRVGSIYSGRTLLVEIPGMFNKQISVPQFSTWDNFGNISFSQEIPEGIYTLRVTNNGTDHVDFNYILFESSPGTPIVSPSPSASPISLPSLTPSSTPTALPTPSNPPTSGVVIYPDPTGLENATNLKKSDLFSVKVNGLPTFVYKSVSRQPTLSILKEAHFAYFSFDGQPVTVTVTKLTGNISSIKARPNNLGISPAVSGNTATFTMTNPVKMMVQVDGASKPLILFADKPDTNIPTGSNVKRFGPGYHIIGRNYPVSDNQIIYIDGGAVVEGTFGPTSGTTMRDNVQLRGRGIIYAGDYPWPGGQSGDDGLWHQAVQNSRLEGIIALDSEFWTFGIRNENTIFENLKLIGWEHNTDGIWFGPNSIVRDSFILTNDDPIRPHSYQTFPDSSSSLVENLTIWKNGWGRAFFMPSYSGLSPYVQNITYRNITYIRDELSYTSHGRSYIPIEQEPQAKLRNILYENIYFEEIIAPNGTVNLGRFFGWYIGSQGGISNITFRNFHTPLTNGDLVGRSSTENISNITFDGFYRNGQKMTSLSQMGLTINQYVNNVVFR